MFEEALGAVFVFLSEDVEDLVGENAGEGPSEKQIGAAEVTAPHGGADGRGDFVAEDDGEGLNLAVGDVGEGEGGVDRVGGGTWRTRGGIDGASALEGGEDELVELIAETDVAAEAEVDGDAGGEEEAVHFEAQLAHDGGGQRLLGVDDDGKRAIRALARRRRQGGNKKKTNAEHQSHRDSSQSKPPRGGLRNTSIDTLVIGTIEIFYERFRASRVEGDGAGWRESKSGRLRRGGVAQLRYAPPYWSDATGPSSAGRE